jgi:hypothetical protein
LGLLSIYCITSPNKKEIFLQDKWIVKDINDRFKFVASKYCDESKQMYKPRNFSPPLSLSNFIAMLANANYDSNLYKLSSQSQKLWILEAHDPSPSS